MSKGEATRGAVVGQALSLASELGLEGLTIGKLATRVGLSKSGLFAHFSSKENLEVAVLEEATRRFVDLVIVPALKEQRGEPRVRALFEGWMRWSKADFMPGGCIFIAAAVELDDRPGPARELLVSTQKDWLGTLAGAARIAVEEKHFRQDLDGQQFAYELYALVYGYHFISRLLSDPKAEQRVRGAFERLLRDARS
jgi:AcrR family transcriptional regulator